MQANKLFQFASYFPTTSLVKWFIPVTDQRLNGFFQHNVKAGTIFVSLLFQRNGATCEFKNAVIY